MELCFYWWTWSPLYVRFLTAYNKPWWHIYVHSLFVSCLCFMFYLRDYFLYCFIVMICCLWIIHCISKWTEAVLNKIIVYSEGIALSSINMLSHLNSTLGVAGGVLEQCAGTCPAAKHVSSDFRGDLAGTLRFFRSLCFYRCRELAQQAAAVE